jgi:hypothetical protein
MVRWIYWTSHALQRAGQRGLMPEEVEDVIRSRHGLRLENAGEADWRLHGVRSDGREFAIAYDHPVFGDPAAVRIVSVWVLRGRARP